MENTRFKHWVTIKEMADMLEVDVMTVRNMLKRGGLLPPTYDFGVKRFAKVDVEKYIANGYVWRETTQ